jgi:hypothetical protein
MFEQRRSGRYEFSGDKLEYTLGSFSEDEIFEASVIDFNQTGLSLLSTNCLSVGQEITIRDFMDVSSQTARVVWSEKCGEESFRAGLIFM